MAALACLILAAGKGKRMRSSLPKVLHPLGGWPMICHVVEAVRPLEPDRVAVVVGPDMAAVAAAVAPWPTVVQAAQRGTGDAVAAARPLLDGFDGDVLVLFGDTPFVTTATFERLVAARRGPGDPAVVALGMRPADAGAYGRLVLDAKGGLARIVEHADASAAERAIGLVNGGLMAFDGKRLWPLIDALEPANAQGEYYLTDTVAAARSQGWAAAVAEAPAEELLGINSRAELAAAEAVLQRRLRERALSQGATMIDPATVYLSADTAIGRDVTIGPFVQLGLGVTIEDEVEIRAFSHIEGAVIRKGALVGPFARLRPGAEIGAGAHVGNFVELKAAHLGAGAKANHLAYLGDAEIGPGANIGAGTIFANYDGYSKSRTVVGEGASIGSNAVLVAPVTVGAGAIVGAGTVVTRDVPPDAMTIGRTPQVDKPGRAATYRTMKAAAKAAKHKG